MEYETRSQFDSKEAPRRADEGLKLKIREAAADVETQLQRLAASGKVTRKESIGRYGEKSVSYQGSVVTAVIRKDERGRTEKITLKNTPRQKGFAPEMYLEIHTGIAPSLQTAERRQDGGWTIVEYGGEQFPLRTIVVAPLVNGAPHKFVQLEIEYTARDEKGFSFS